MTDAVAADSNDRTRLHITPFSPALLDAVIAKPKQSLVTSLSYHQAQNDPDRGFGYLELPADEAEKLKRKLNGSVLRGHKMSIETARPEKRKAARDAKADKEETKRPRKKVDSKAGPAEEITGVELPADRKVKRGWTEAGGKATKKGKDGKQEKSKFTDKDEALFRTGRKDDPAKSKKKSGDKTKSSKQGVVHEFEKSSKFPTFLKSEPSNRQGAPPTFEDGKGWVDEDGNVVEEVKTRRTRASAQRDVTSKSAEGALGITGLVPEPAAQLAQDSPEEASDSSSSSSEESSESASDSSGESDAIVGADVIQSTEKKPIMQTPTISVTTEMQPPARSETPVDSTPKSGVHPLEALYKRRPDSLPKPARLDTTFAFGFGGEEGEKGIPVGSAVAPQTPFTRADSRGRDLRSAAPTPDTAVASRKFFPSQDDDEDDNSEGSADEAEHEQTKNNTASNTGAGNGERSAFVKEFYERRSELNQGFKQRRREAKKQQRQREERSFGRRAL